MFRTITLTLASICLALACSSSSSSSASKPCNEDPWECPAGQTCWPKDPSSFECLNSGSGTAGSTCNNSVGVPTCGDSLACLQLSSSPGLCVAYCDPTDVHHACPSGETCRMVIVGGARTLLNVCVGSAATGEDSGTAVNDAGAD